MNNKTFKPDEVMWENVKMPSPLIVWIFALITKTRAKSGETLGKFCGRKGGKKIYRYIK